jgi:hypothetical protein
LLRPLRSQRRGARFWSPSVQSIANPPVLNDLPLGHPPR